MHNKPEPTLATLGLLFWEQFPGPQAGDCIELQATAKRNIWRGGHGEWRDEDATHNRRKLIGYKNLDYRLIFEDNERYLSRIHCTFYYDRRSQQWLLVDGGVYEGEGITTPSRNGIWACGQGTNYEWQRITAQLPLYPSDKILLSPGKRLIIAASCRETTLGDYLWEEEQWNAYKAKPKAKAAIAPTVEKDLARHANGGNQRPVTLWTVLQDWSDWLQAWMGSTPKDPVEAINKALVGLLMLSVAFGVITGLVLWQLDPPIERQE